MAKQISDLDQIFSNQIADNDFLVLRDTSSRKDMRVSVEALKTAFSTVLNDLGSLAWKDSVESSDIAWTGMRVAGKRLNRSGVLGETKPVVVLYGWDFGTSTGGTITKAVNFGMTFKTPPTVIVQTLGYKSSSDPTSQSDTSGVASEVARGGEVTSTTGTTVFITSENGGVIGNGARILFNIIVIGEPE